MQLKKLLLCTLSILAFAGTLFATTLEELPLIPAPKSIESAGKAVFKMPSSVTIAAPKVLGSEATILRNILKKRVKVSASKAKGSSGTITLSVNKRIKNREAYELNISRSKISIVGGSPAGVYYGIRTLEQLLAAEGKTLPELKIVDEPRFGYRGLMLDPARNFLPVEDVMHFVETMASFKYNTLHFHISEDQGWRVEIKNPKYKKLMTVSAQKNKPEGTRGYYTQKEITQLVKFAAKHHVDVIPEVDMPGHNMGAICAYPELTCEYIHRVNDDPELLKANPKMKLEIWERAGVSEALLCAGKESTYKFYNDILSELCELFPSKYFHIGGDEAPTKCWGQCKDCQEKMKKEGLKSPQDLMSYFFQRNFDALGKAGKTALYWYELDVPKYPENAIMYAWRMGLTPRTIDRALKEGYRVICCPGEHAYLDYPQINGDPNHGWMPVTTLKRTYDFDPGYGRPENEQKAILGCEGTLWAEHLKTLEKIYYQAYPRALALVEAGWSPMNRRGWDNFKVRAAPIVRELRKNGVASRWPTEEFGEE